MEPRKCVLRPVEKMFNEICTDFRNSIPMWYDVPEKPSDDDLGSAREILHSILHAFPFEDAASYAHAIAALLQPFVRELYQGPTPMIFVNITCPGQWGLLFGKIMAQIASGSHPHVATGCKTSLDLRVSITNGLLSEAPTLLLTGLSGNSITRTLSAMLTSQIWRDCLFGHYGMVELPIRCQVIGTGCKPKFSPELVRRIVPITLTLPEGGLQEDQGKLQAGMLEVAKKKRGDVIWSLFVMVQNWINQGQPDSKKIRPAFQDWSRVIGGILDLSGVAGFLGNISSNFNS